MYYTPNHNFIRMLKKQFIPATYKQNEDKKKKPCTDHCHRWSFHSKAPNTALNLAYMIFSGSKNTSHVKKRNKYSE